MSARSALLALLLLCVPALLGRAQGNVPGEAGAQPSAESELGAGDTPAPAPESSTDASAARRGLELAAREAALRTLEADLQAKLEELRQLRALAQETLEPKRQREVEDVLKLVKFYQSMKPQNAANLLEALPLPLATSVLRAMKAREAAKILNVMEADRAVQISRLMAGK